MITQLKLLPNRYSENTILNSKETRYLKIKEGIKTLCAGGHIRIPKNMQKIVMTERLHDTVIDRYFIQLAPGKLIPVYMKIYGVGEANVLLFKNGVNHVRNTLAVDSDTSENIFLKDVLFEHVIDELEAIEPYIAEEVIDYTDAQHSAIMLIANDTGMNRSDSNIYYTSYRSENDLKTMTVNDTVCDEPTSNCGYPWNIINTSSSDIKWAVVDESPKHIAGHLYDLSIQVNMFIPNNRTSHPLFLRLDDQFLPCLGETYDPIAYDPLSKLSILKSEIDSSIITKIKTRNLKQDCDRYIKINDRQFNEVERITAFTSKLLEVCVIIHQYPIHEFYFNYILPTKKNTGSVTYSGVMVKNKISGEDINYFMQITLPEVLRAWNCKLNEISIIKTGDEEILISTKDNGVIKHYYIDLFMTTVLSQSVIQSS